MGNPTQNMCVSKLNRSEGSENGALPLAGKAESGRTIQLMNM